MPSGNGTAASANKFYLNVYTKLAGPTKFYDCRYDYEPTLGSTSQFTTATFAATAIPVNVVSKTPGCATTLAAMPSTSTVSFIALNVGDTSASDTG